jgi:predicted RNA binding protein YcfA (HicA-like mRNA interferase family)
MGFVLTAARMKKLLASRGFRIVSQKGSHLKLTDGKRVTIVADKPGDMPEGTTSRILSQAGISKKEARKWAGMED